MPEQPTAPEDRLAPVRAALAERQTALLAALVAGGPVPEGFEEARIREQGRGLAAKRRETLALVVPEVEHILGADYGPLFLRYAEGHPLTGGYRGDARAFAEWALAELPRAPWRRELTGWLDPPGRLRAPWRRRAR
ncbi:hypothetical protein ABWK59_24125 [Kitasatospora sp. HUAS MG31]|uniref:SCO6045-like C-terminal domain-containing protein n=1 Tax=Kitasatospora camelliae TaxID=3156397 RepID=A0AAU8K0U7_9ACTN